MIFLFQYYFISYNLNFLGFSNEEKYNIYKLTAVVMHMGNLAKDFVPVGKEEQAEVRNEDNAHKVCSLSGFVPWWITLLDNGILCI